MSGTAEATEERAEPGTAVRAQAMAWWPVGLIAVAVGALLLSFSGRYGYYGDELYFLAAGHHPAWGYVDQPPLTPLLAAGMNALFPGSVMGIRLPSTIATALFPVVTALMAHEFGANRRGQIIAALAAAVSPMLLSKGHLLNAVTLDSFCWATVIWLLARWARTREEWPLLAAGVATAIALQLDYLIVGFWIVAAVVLLMMGPHRLLRRWGIWCGILFAVLTTLPSFFWQMNHNWPQLDMAKLISAANTTGGARGLLLPTLFVLSGLILGAPLMCYGLWRLLRSPRLAPFRFLGWITVGVVVLFLVVAGSYDYINGLMPLCWAAGAAEFVNRPAARWWRWVASPSAIIVSAGLAISYALPLDTEQHAIAAPRGTSVGVDTIGWPHFADQVAAAYHSLPPNTAIITEGYWHASALARYGPERGLPSPYSPDRGYFYFGEPPESATSVLFLGVNSEYLRQRFQHVRKVVVTDSRFGPYSATNGITLWACDAPKASWQHMWPKMRTPH